MVSLQRDGTAAVNYSANHNKISIYNNVFYFDLLIDLEFDTVWDR